MKLMLTVTKYIFLCFVLYSCSNTSLQKHEDAYRALAEITIHKYVKPIMPPPPPNLSDVDFKSVSDSIRANFNWTDTLNVQLFADNAIKIVEDDEFKANGNLDKLTILYDKGISYDMPIDISKIHSTDKIKIHKGDISSSSKSWEGTDVKIYMSKIVFNKKGSECQLIISVSRGKLSGFSVFSSAKKQSGKWFFVKTDVFEIS